MNFQSSTQAKVDDLFSASQEFFSQLQPEKNKCTSPHEVYFGYQQRPEFDKELFQVRCAPERVQAAWPATVPQLKPTARAVFSDMNQLVVGFTELALQHISAQRAEPTADALMEEKVFDHADELSMSNLSLFHYQYVSPTLTRFLIYHFSAFLKDSCACLCTARTTRMYPW